MRVASSPYLCCAAAVQAPPEITLTATSEPANHHRTVKAFSVSFFSAVWTRGGVTGDDGAVTAPLIAATAHRWRAAKRRLAVYNGQAGRAPPDIRPLSLSQALPEGRLPPKAQPQRFAPRAWRRALPEAQRASSAARVSIELPWRRYGGPGRAPLAARFQPASVEFQAKTCY